MVVEGSMYVRPIHIVNNTPGKTGPEYRVSHRQQLIQYPGCPYPMKNNVILIPILKLLS